MQKWPPGIKPVSRGYFETIPCVPMELAQITKLLSVVDAAFNGCKTNGVGELLVLAKRLL
jgi:hypothetical protein